jgi:nitrous oxide reductase accessory protein NosL
MCGMKIVDHRDWTGAIETRGGEVFYFCGPRCTIATARRSERFLGIGPDAIGRVLVPDYLRPERSLDAKSAYFVVGSDVRGPMGAALLPAATETDAETLVRRHGGRLVRYDDVDDALLKSLKDPRAVPAASPPPAP